MQFWGGPPINVHLRKRGPPRAPPNTFYPGLKPCVDEYVTNTWPTAQVAGARPRGEPWERRGKKWKVDVKVPFWTLFRCCDFDFAPHFGSLEGSLAECAASRRLSNDHSNDQGKHEGTKLEFPSGLKPTNFSMVKVNFWHNWLCENVCDFAKRVCFLGHWRGHWQNAQRRKGLQ